MDGIVGSDPKSPAAVHACSKQAVLAAPDTRSVRIGECWVCRPSGVCPFAASPSSIPDRGYIGSLRRPERAEVLWHPNAYAEGAAESQLASLGTGRRAFLSFGRFGNFNDRCKPTGCDREHVSEPGTEGRLAGYAQVLPRCQQPDRTATQLAKDV